MKPRLSAISTPLTVASLALTAWLAAGCAGKPPPSAPAPPDKPATRVHGGFYGGDRPPDSVPVDLDGIPDATPRHEPLSATGNAPYTALGKRYHPLKTAHGYVKRGTASWYGRKFHGRRTSSGEAYDMFAMTAAHPLLPLPTYARVTNLDNGKSVVVKINDRGPFLHGRLIDLSFAAAHKLDIADHGTGRVEVRAMGPGGQADNGIEPQAAAERILIQVGAYSNLDNARRMRQKLHRAGYPVTSPGRTQGGIYRVRVGPYASRAAARRNQQSLEAMLQRPVVIIETVNNIIN